MAELEATVSAREMIAWSDYYDLEPWGAMRDNIHAGIVASMLFNVNRGRAEKPRTFNDFLLITNEEEIKQTKTQQFVVALRAMAKPKKSK